MFHELRDGIVRLDPDLARLLAAELMPRFAKAELEAAHSQAKRFRRMKVPYRLELAQKVLMQSRLPSLSKVHASTARNRERG